MISIGGSVAAYIVGLIPMTIPYARKIYDLDAIERVSATDDIAEKCKIFEAHEPSREKYIKDDVVYFSFDEGSKRIHDLLDYDLYTEYLDLITACQESP